MSQLRHRERVAVARLHALLELLPTALDRELTATGLSSFEFNLLEALHESEAQRLRLSALASRTNATLARLSRVVTGLEHKGLVARAACEDDGRAINAVLTETGAKVYQDVRPRYDEAVRRIVLDGLDDDGVDRLAEMSYAILTKLDPERRMAVTADDPDVPCAADPAPAPAPDECPADPRSPAS